MADFYPSMPQTCELVTTIRNQWAGYKQQSRTSLPCRWRQIPTQYGGQYGEERDSDALVHLHFDAPVSIGSILVYENIFYEVERLTEARRLGETNVQFLKCEVRIVDSLIS